MKEKFSMQGTETSNLNESRTLMTDIWSVIFISRLMHSIVQIVDVKIDVP
jgi:hypothetical protein